MAGGGGGVGGGIPPETASSGTDVAMRTAIDYLDGAERMRHRLEAEAAAEARRGGGGGGGGPGALATSAAQAGPPGAAPPPPPPENVELVVPDDKLLLTDYFYHLMRQLKLCRFSESDRKTRGGKRENVPVGYGGLQCVHCAGAPNSRKFFWSNVDRLANSFAEIPGHVLKCRRCPARTKGALQELKLRHPEQMSKLPRGSQKVFFRRMWRRLHDDDPQQQERPPPQPSDGKKKSGGAAAGGEGEGGKAGKKTKGAKKEDEIASAEDAKPSASAGTTAASAMVVASPAASSSAAGSSRTPTGGRESAGGVVGDMSAAASAAAGTMQGVFATPIAPRGARSSLGGGGDIAAVEEGEEEEDDDGFGPTPRKRRRSSSAQQQQQHQQRSVIVASPSARGSPAALVVSGTTGESAHALAASASPLPPSSSRHHRGGGPPSSSRQRRRPRVLLAIDEDKEWLSDTDCFVRSNVEVFVATALDVEQAKLDRKYPIAEGQVGIRCLHCASTAPESDGSVPPSGEDDRSRGARGNAVSYPYSISGIYESVREFQRLHLESCRNLTPEVRSRLLGHQGSASLSSVLRRYYVMAAKALGMVDTNDGIRASGESVGVGSGATFEFASGSGSSSGGGGGGGKGGGRGGGGGGGGTPSPATVPRPSSRSSEQTPLSRSIEGLGMTTPAALGAGGGAVTPGVGGPLSVMGMGSPLVSTPAGQTPPHLLGVMGQTPPGGMGGVGVGGMPHHHHLGPPQASSAAGGGQPPPPFGGMGLESAMTPLEGRKRKASRGGATSSSPGDDRDEEGRPGSRRKRG